MTPSIQPLSALKSERFETAPILKALAAASRQLAEFKGVAASIPNQGILINTLTLQEAKDSSAIENIVTSHDELFRDAAYPDAPGSLAAKEVLRYSQALRAGYDMVLETGLLTNKHLVRVQEVLELNRSGFRKLPGTALKSAAGVVVYTPPQDAREIVRLMKDLEQFINGESGPLDPLIRMALIHHQFESIHPFYDGNGRTGRILNVLYLVKEHLLDTPVLYMSREIVRTKATYYTLLQAVRDRDAWEEWVLYILGAVEATAAEGIRTVALIKQALMEVKQLVRTHHKFYSQDLINNLFSHPYTKIDFLKDDLGVSRLTATKYLEELVGTGILEKVKVGRFNFYINIRLFAILSGTARQRSPRAAR